jgi:hypothetical protein
MCKANEYTQKIIGTFNQGETDYNKLYSVVHTCDLKTNDLLHEIELNQVNGMYNAYLLVKEIKEVREIRRQAKNELETLLIFKIFKRNYEKELNKLLENISKKQDIIKHRKYCLRVPCDIKELEIIKTRNEVVSC